MELHTYSEMQLLSNLENLNGLFQEVRAFLWHGQENDICLLCTKASALFCTHEYINPRGYDGKVESEHCCVAFMLSFLIFLNRGSLFYWLFFPVVL